MTSFCHDAASRFFFIVTHGDPKRPWIAPEDFAPLIQDVVDTHPGLAFLKEASEFHSRYVHTVIARIYYAVNRSWTGKITLAELRRSNLLDVSIFFADIYSCDRCHHGEKFNPIVGLKSFFRPRFGSGYLAK